MTSSPVHQRVYKEDRKPRLQHHSISNSGSERTYTVSSSEDYQTTGVGLRHKRQAQDLGKDSHYTFQHCTLKKKPTYLDLEKNFILYNIGLR